MLCYKQSFRSDIDGAQIVDLFQIETFLTVAREGSFSRAAKKLYRTQPAISQTIRKLEDELGESLFDRSSRRVSSPTRARCCSNTPKSC